LLLDDSDPVTRENFLRRAAEQTLSPEDMQHTHGSIAPWMASITFGGADLRTVYVGSLLGHRIPYFRSPVAGLPMVHW